MHTHIREDRWCVETKGHFLFGCSNHSYSGSVRQKETNIPSAYWLCAICYYILYICPIWEWFKYNTPSVEYTNAECHSSASSVVRKTGSRWDSTIVSLTIIASVPLIIYLLLHPLSILLPSSWQRILTGCGETWGIIKCKTIRIHREEKW